MKDSLQIYKEFKLLCNKGRYDKAFDKLVENQGIDKHLSLIEKNNMIMQLKLRGGIYSDQK